MLSSFYFHGAIITTILTQNIWMNDDWWEIVFSIFPSMLGFTLGVLGIIIGASTSAYGEVVSEFDPSIRATKHRFDAVFRTPLGKLAGTFSHFLIFQFVVIGLGLIARSLYSTPCFEWAPVFSDERVVQAWWLICGFLANYAFFLSLATILWLFKVATTIIMHHQIVMDDREKKS